jgi:tetratricopeptide (TPR) repeat protein
MILKRYEEALECYNELKAMNPEFEDDLLVLNEIYMWLEMYKEHLPVLDKLLLIEKDNLFYLFYRARVLNELDRKEESLEAFNKYIHSEGAESDDFYIFALTQKANVLHDLDRCGEAVETYDEILEIDGDNSNALIGKGNALVKMSRYDEAGEIRDILKNNSDNAGAYILEACEYRNKNQLSEALDILERIDDAPATYDQAIAMMKVDILKKMNRLDDALEVCDSYIESHIEFMDFDYGDFKVSREFPQSKKIFSLREEILGEMDRLDAGESSK